MAQKVIYLSTPPEHADSAVVSAAIAAAARVVGVCRVSGIHDPNLPAIGQVVGKVAKEILAELGRDD